MLLNELAEKVAELYNLPYLKEGVRPKSLSPFVTIKRGNKKTLEIVDALSASGGILIFRSTGCSSSSARVLASCDWYVRVYTSIKDTVSGHTGAVPSANINIVFFGSFQKDKVFDLGILPLELVEKPQFYGLI